MSGAEWISENLIFDTHAHYDDKAFDKDREQLLESLAGHGIGAVVNVGADLGSTARAIALAQKYSFIYAAAGVHPTETKELDEESFRQLAGYMDEPKVIAVGEIGLDYHWDTPRDVQKLWFGRQLALAVEKELPVIIHSRDAAADTLRQIQEARETAAAEGKKLTGVIHCFSYEPEIALEYVKMGFWIGIGGVVTFKNARKVKEVVQQIPLEKLVLETDCPYLAPAPYRQERNSSLYLPFIAEEIARLRNVAPEEIVRVTARNARELYQLD